MFGSFGWMELMLILIIVLIIFGAGKIPQLGEGLGKAIKGFKKSVHEAEAFEAEADAQAQVSAPAPQATQAPPAAATPPAEATATATEPQAAPVSPQSHA